MRELEIKARLPNKQMVLDALQGEGIKLSEPIRQHDTVYGLPGASDDPTNHNWLRIRIENDKRAIFTLKRSVVGQLDNIEHETDISDPEAMTAIILVQGYQKYSEVTKTRQTARLDDGIELCLDEIQGLGSFVEVETIVPETTDHDEVEAMLWRHLGRLGVRRADEETRGYDVIMKELWAGSSTSGQDL